MHDGFVIRTTVFIPAAAVTRQTGKVSGDAIVVTLQKQFSTAVCYYALKAYVKEGLNAIPFCTVHRKERATRNPDEKEEEAGR